MKRIVLAGLVLAVIAAACGDDTGSGSAGESNGPNDADVAFAREMIAHHEQAVMMAQIAQDQASTDEVRDLARRIEKAQSPEIETLEAWLEEWGESEDSGGRGDMDNGEMEGGEMPGMMSDEKMGELASAPPGKGFDRMFLAMMIEHHEGAIATAEEEIEGGESSAAIDLAESIVSAQENEIEEIEALLQDSR